MISIYLNINLELLIKLVASNLSMWAEGHPYDTWHPQGNPLRGMASRKSYKYWIVSGRGPKVFQLTVFGKSG